MALVSNIDMVVCGCAWRLQCQRLALCLLESTLKASLSDLGMLYLTLDQQLHSERTHYRLEIASPTAPVMGRQGLEWINVWCILQLLQ